MRWSPRTLLSAGSRAWIRTSRSEEGGIDPMPELDKGFLRKLAEWRSNAAPVSSLYLDVDGRRYPRKQDYELRAEELVHSLRSQAVELDRDARGSVGRDADRMMGFVRALDRGGTRGVALFSCASEGLWQEVLVPRGLRDRAVVAEQPYVLPLEAMVETYQSFCTVIVDREKARIFLSRMGRIHEASDIFDDVPGRHDQGGWSQARYQRHIEEHVGKHLKRVAEVLLGFYKRKTFDHLILAGPEEILPPLEQVLHDYLRQRVVARETLAITSTETEVLRKSLAVEERVEAARERRTLQRLRAESAAGRQAVMGLDASLSALNGGRVDTLLVPFGVSRKGVRCSSCGRLALEGERCATCGGRMAPVPDVVESAVTSALRQSARVETLSVIELDRPEESDIGALLRY
jgi:peptide chain release factor subunit 1